MQPLPLENLPLESPEPGSSYQRTIARFNSPAVAEFYPHAYGTTFRERREVACIRRSLRFLAAQATVLDLPCGTGRLLPLLGEAGLQVTAADVSPHAVAIAQGRWSEGSTFSNRMKFTVCEINKTGFEDGQFEGVLCHRLFHHFNEPKTRIVALLELRRICRGPIIVSFFNSFAFEALRFRLKHLVRGTTPTDRIPIPLRRLRSEVEEADLEILARYAVLWGISPLWFLVLRRKRP